MPIISREIFQVIPMLTIQGCHFENHWSHFSLKFLFPLKLIFHLQKFNIYYVSAAPEIFISLLLAFVCLLRIGQNHSIPLEWYDHNPQTSLFQNKNDLCFKHPQLHSALSWLWLPFRYHSSSCLCTLWHFRSNIIERLVNKQEGHWSMTSHEDSSFMNGIMREAGGTLFALSAMRKHIQGDELSTDSALLASSSWTF